jgi:hypothetical protein
LHLMVLGIAIVTVTIIPIVVAGRTVIFGIQWDRYTAQSMFGVAMVMGGLAFYALRTPARWVFLFSLIAIGVITQFYSAVYYRDFWTQEREVWWQLAWRAPDFKPDTTVIAAFPHGYRLAEEYEVWSPLNIIYNPGGPIKVSGQIPFDGIALDLASGTQETRHMRSILVPRDYGKALILSKPTENSCAHLINGKQLELPSNEDPAIASIAVYSQIDLVDTSAAPKTPPAELFGPEPDHTWCYYYQKIDLARQMEDWGDAAHLADQAASLDLKPADRSEWLPALEAYVNAGEPDKARQVAKYIRADKSLRTVLCDQIEGTQEWPASYDPEQIVNTLCGSGN